MGVISSEDWPDQRTSAIVTAKKKNGKLRVSLDPGELSKHLQPTVHLVATVEGLLPDVRKHVYSESAM